MRIAIPRGHVAFSVAQTGLLDVVVAHTEVMPHLVKHGVVHLVNQFGVGRAPALNVALEQHDPLRV
jgi:hypothetical protein